MENRKQLKKSPKEKICVFLVMVGLVSIVYFIATSLRNERIEEIKFIKADFHTIRGIVTEKHTYKGNSIHVKYKVDGKFYEGIDGFEERYKFDIGDSLYIKYSKTKPELMITEYNSEY